MAHRVNPKVWRSALLAIGAAAALAWLLQSESKLQKESSELISAREAVDRELAEYLRLRDLHGREFEAIVDAVGTEQAIQKTLAIGTEKEIQWRRLKTAKERVRRLELQ